MTTGISPLQPAVLPPEHALITPAGPPVVWVLDHPDDGSPRFVAEHPGATLYDSLPWQQALRTAGLGGPVHLLATIGNDVVGTLPVTESLDASGERCLLSLPATPAAGILADDASVRWLLASRAATLAESRGIKGIWLRRFLPDGAIAGAHTRLGWARVPLAEFEEHLGTTSGHIRSAPFRRQDLSSFPDVPDGVPLEVLRALSTNSALHLTTGTRSGNDERPLGVWTVVNAHVHVLAIDASIASSPDFARLLQQAAGDGLARGASWIDFPCPAAVPPGLGPLLHSPDALWAVERRLDLEHLDQS